jgi:hypothetical protein
MEHEKEAKNFRNQQEEQKQLMFEMESDLLRLRAENSLLTAEREQLAKDRDQTQGAMLQLKEAKGETDRLIQESHVLYMNV